MHSQNNSSGTNSAAQCQPAAPCYMQGMAHGDLREVDGWKT
ncbi:MAG: hypothetical protein WC568_01945 [Candidatus Methanoperedens sp.]